MAMMDKNCREFVEALASKAPVPGGGGAAAYGGAVGMALSTMVGNYTVGKKKYADVEDEVKELMAQGEKIQAELLALVEKDAEVFEPLSKAYGLPTETDEQKKIKAETLEKESINACSVPMEIMRKAYEGIKVHKRMGEIGSLLVISDVGCGVVFLKSALIAGKLNVVINLKTIKDEEFVSKAREEMERLVAEGCKIADETLEAVIEKIS
ncbi:methenyltetrahydrofolate cyclohydrolase FchA [Peptoclostridium acidaminophilum DSM 3953]|uniref:Methenyltetrahydrofolate cyclohydrolase FchA n=1 Tax=Peptoclostridium acidaminophilum DSM 3953 TaxID=1286171 RepID=W8T805_PEPAC|nr:cyclodeaminase/cyclohydrolase family protein [Peptoclostridium acidaminophilum]AHM57020.1 methenyltetrahydrofolate cyclohydrolase FchA [Peptoclostridium acidaminophilum DSM 3953]